MKKHNNKPINEKISARFFIAPGVKTNGLNTWTKLFVLTKDNILYCEYLEFMNPAKVIEKVDFENFKAGDYSWGKGKFQHLNEIDYHAAKNTILERQNNWVDRYLQEKYNQLLEE